MLGLTDQEGTTYRKTRSFASQTALSCLVLSCLVLSYLVSCLVSCLVLSCLVSSIKTTVGETQTDEMTLIHIDPFVSSCSCVTYKHAAIDYGLINKTRKHKWTKEQGNTGQHKSTKEQGQKQREAHKVENKGQRAKAKTLTLTLTIDPKP